MRPNKLRIWLLILITGLGSLLLSIPAVSAPSSQSTPPAPQDTRGLEQAIADALSDESGHLPVIDLFQTSIEEAEVSEDGLWGRALLVPQDPESGELLPSEPGLAIARWDGSAWQVFLPGDPGWIDALEQTPDSLLSAEHKQYYREIYETALAAAPEAPVGGYLLPWAGGMRRYLSQSIFHDQYTTSGSAHYAFDFYTSGQMWNVYSARSGTVWLWKDDVATCLASTCSATQAVGNYLVIQDTTTNPATYQLYLHLAQGSIPPALKARGAPVIQGQMIGIADNTGQSWGHHLHFQVHTNPASYWGFAVDILFADVDINGGRPRTPAEAAAYPQEGSAGRVDYVSQNYVRDDPTPPKGDVLEPYLTGFEVSNGRLSLEGWATDAGSGVASARFTAFYNNTWHEIGPGYSSLLFQYEWDLCASGVPVGPLSIGVKVVDYANNQTPAANGVRHGVNNTNCGSPPPTCTPTSSQVALFAGADFTGECSILTVGSYPTASLLGAVGDERTSSIKVGSGVRATLFGESSLAGRSETLTGNDASLADNVIGDNTVSSIQVAARNDPAAAPSLVWPAEGTAFTTNDSLTFSWRDGGGAGRYDLEILAGSTVQAGGSSTSPWWRMGSLAPGNYTWRVRAYNPANSPGSWSAARPFSVTPAASGSGPGYTLPYTDTLETLDPGWVPSGSWLWTSDPNLARSPDHAWVFSAPAAEGTYGGSLTSPQIQVPPGGASLAFYYRYQSEGPGTNWDQRVVQISQNGGPFNDVLQLSNDPLYYWLKSPPVDLSAYAGSTIRVRFVIQSLDSVNNSPLSWAIDDLVLSTATPGACLDPGEPDNTPAQARTIQAGIPSSGVLCRPGDIDYYQFTVTQPGTSLVMEMDAQFTGSALDPHLTLLDGDGKSPLAESDDEIPFQLIDPRLGYTFTRTGTYYLKVRAWNHPEAGSPAHTYTLALRQEALVRMATPTSEGALQVPELRVRVLGQDNGGVVEKVSFFWHADNWTNQPWIPLGEDLDGSDGWSVPFDPGSLPDHRGLAFAALVEDRSGRTTAAAAWEVTLDRSAPQTVLGSLPASSDSTAVLLNWTGSDNLAGLGAFDLQFRISGAADWSTLTIPDGSQKSAWVIGDPGKSYEYRMRGVDAAGNAEAYPASAEAQTSIQTCTSPDAWDASGSGDDQYTTATLLGSAPQTHNFCDPGDQDWYAVSLGAGAQVPLAVVPTHGASAPVVRVYRLDGGTLTLVQEVLPAQFGMAATLTLATQNPVTYYLQVSHLDPRVAGAGVGYQIYLAELQTQNFPFILR
jgi:murein DD-endopeptidase MepM/ murein hydrolase activator NlpD